MSAPEERARDYAERREAEEFAARYLDVGPFRLGGRAVVAVLRRLFRTPGAARAGDSPAPPGARADLPEPVARPAKLSAGRADEIAALLDECGLPVTEERVSTYAEMDDATFETVAEHLRDAHRRARHPLQIDAERRARERADA